MLGIAHDGHKNPHQRHPNDGGLRMWQIYCPLVITSGLVSPRGGIFSTMYPRWVDWCFHHQCIIRINSQKRLDIRSSKPCLIPSCEWPWHNHPTICKSTWSKRYRIFSLMRPTSRGSWEKQFSTANRGNCLSIRAINWLMWCRAALRGINLYPHGCIFALWMTTPRQLPILSLCLQIIPQGWYPRKEIATKWIAK